jgi:uncharacterized protein (DUF302 family)
LSAVEYGYEKRLGGVGIDEAVDMVTEALKKEGFGVLTDIDVKSTFKKKLDIDFRNYKILGACNPVFARQALEADPQIGLLLPCNVVVQELEDGAIGVSIVNPKTMFKLVKNPTLESMAEEVDSRLRRVLAALECGD